jgi:hypothetical protein
MASVTARNLFLLENSALPFDGNGVGGKANMTYFKAGIN